MNKEEFLQSIRKQIHFAFDRDPIEIGKALNKEHHPLLGYLLNPYSLLIIVAITLLTGFVILGSAHSGSYYSQPIREVEQLSTDYYLGPIIDVNNNNISNIKYYEELDGITESASPIGYYMQLEYKESDIKCEITINSFPLEKYDGDLKNSKIHVYEGHEIYMWKFLDEERNLRK